MANPSLHQSAYPEARFVSEHGVQSFPSAASYEEVTAPQDRRMSAAMMANRSSSEMSAY